MGTARSQNAPRSMSSRATRWWVWGNFSRARASGGGGDRRALGWDTDGVILGWLQRALYPAHQFEALLGRVRGQCCAGTSVMPVIVSSPFSS